MNRWLVAMVPLAVAAAPAIGQTTLITQRYACERGVEVPVAYIAAADASVAVLTVEGRQIALYLEQSVSGARYAWPSDGSGYVWWTKDDGATLLWKDGTTGTETTLLADCDVVP